MKYLLILLFVPGILFAQESAKTVQYRIDILKADSFYLVEQAISGMKDRPDTTRIYNLFADTAEFRTYIEGRVREVNRVKRELDRLQLEFDSLDSRLTSIKALALDTFTMNVVSNVGNRAALAPTVSEPAGFWVFYSRPTGVEFVSGVEKIKRNAVVLNKNGTTFEFKTKRKNKK